MERRCASTRAPQSMSLVRGRVQRARVVSVSTHNLRFKAQRSELNIASSLLCALDKE